MWRKCAIALTAAVFLGAAATPTGVLAAPGGGGHGGGGGGRGGGFSGGRSFSVPGNFSRGVPGGAFVNRGVSRHTFVPPGGTLPANRSAPANVLANRHVIGNGRFAWIGNHRVHGHHRHGFIPGIGLAYYWYYDDCIVWVDGYGWVNLCGDDYGPYGE
jgi:hypothetical protein